MSRYLLDTNVISAAIRDPGGSVDQALRRYRNEEIGTSLIVHGEILFGLKRKPSIRGKERLEALLETLEVWPLESPADEVYGDIRASLEKQGQSMGPNDMWIAAQAIALDATLVTDDRAFSRLSQLKIENWVRV